MTSPSPTLRCAFCGDDLTAVVDERGKDNPGDCPECGTSIRDSLNVGCGVGWQQRRSIHTYFAFIEEAIRRPNETALVINRTRGLSELALMHLVATAITMALVWTPLLVISAAAHNDVPTTGDLASLTGFALVCGLAFAAVAYILNCLCVVAANAITRRSINPAAIRAASVIGMSWAPLIGFTTLVFLPLGMLCGIGGFLAQNFIVWTLAFLPGAEIHTRYSLGVRLGVAAMSLAVPFTLWRAIRTTLTAREALLPVASREKGPA